MRLPDNSAMTIRYRNCDELNQYGNGDAVNRAKARSIGSSILGSKAKEGREEEQSSPKSCSLSKLPVTCLACAEAVAARQQ